MAEPITVYYPVEIFSRKNESGESTQLGATSDKIERYALFKCRDYKMIGKDTAEVQMSVTPVFHIGICLPNDFGETITQNWSPQAIGLKGVFSSLAQKAGGKLGALLGNTISAGAGLAINPAEELVYTGPEFRSFNFKFEFIPRSKIEESHVKLILLLFKQYCLPQLGVASAYLTFPSVWEIELSGIDDTKGDEQNLLKFGFKDKYFALTSYNVEYTPDGAFTSFHDGWPTKVVLSLTFQETMPMYRSQQDIGSLSSDRISDWLASAMQNLGIIK
jgi:hypothetical protein